jgi:hypothetical protein
VALADRSHARFLSQMVDLRRGGVTDIDSVSGEGHRRMPAVPKEPPDRPGHPGVGRLHALWSGAVGIVGTVVGLAPHVLHHVGLLVGTALVAGAAGTLIFGLLGLAASVPMLLRLKRRFGTWWAPALGLAVFAAMFSLSAFVIGPAISGNDQAEQQQQLPTPTPYAEHHS